MCSFRKEDHHRIHTSRPQCGQWLSAGRWALHYLPILLQPLANPAKHSTGKALSRSSQFFVSPPRPSHPHPPCTLFPQRPGAPCPSASPPNLWLPGRESDGICCYCVRESESTVTRHHTGCQVASDNLFSFAVENHRSPFMLGQTVWPAATCSWNPYYRIVTEISSSSGVWR